MSIYRIWNVKCHKCKGEARYTVVDRPICPFCESEDIEYDEKP